MKWSRRRKVLNYEWENGKLVPKERIVQTPYIDPDERVPDYHDNDVQELQDWIEKVSGKKLPTRIAENGQEVRPLDYDREDIRSLARGLEPIFDSLKDLFK